MQYKQCAQAGEKYPQELVHEVQAIQGGTMTHDYVGGVMPSTVHLKSHATNVAERGTSWLKTRPLRYGETNVSRFLYLLI